MARTWRGWKKNTKGVILEQKGTRVAEDGEDWNELEMTILKSLAIFFKIHQRWRGSFKGAQSARNEVIFAEE